MSFWWCLTHGAVEGSPREDTGCRNTDRLGPYETAEQAERALESTRARTAAEDARDEADDDWDQS